MGDASNLHTFKRSNGAPLLPQTQHPQTRSSASASCIIGCAFKSYTVYIALLELHYFVTDSQGFWGLYAR